MVAGLLKFGNSLLFVIAVLCALVGGILYYYSSSGDNYPSRIPEEMKSIKITRSEARSLSEFHKNLARVFDKNSSKYKNLEQFKSIYNDSWNMIFANHFTNCEEISTYVCTQINGKLHVTNEKQLKRELTRQDKDDLVIVISEISKSFDEYGR